MEINIATAVFSPLEARRLVKLPGGPSCNCTGVVVKGCMRWAHLTRAFLVFQEIFEHSDVEAADFSEKPLGSEGVSATQQVTVTIGHCRCCRQFFLDTHR